MKALVVFDSNFGNTQKVAEYVATLLGGDSHAVNVTRIRESDLTGAGLLIVGSPINAWNATKNIRNFLNQLKPGMVKGMRGAAFDTRINSLISGNAAKKIAKTMTDCGIKMIADPTGFFVEAKDGPLKNGELRRAEMWVQAIQTKLQ